MTGIEHTMLSLAGSSRRVRDMSLQVYALIHQLIHQPEGARIACRPFRDTLATERSRTETRRALRQGGLELSHTWSPIDPACCFALCCQI